MRYVSTRGESAPIGFLDAVLAGLAPDGGLYVPAEWPSFTAKEIAAFARLIGCEAVGMHIGFVPEESTASYRGLLADTRDLLDELAAHGQRMHLETGQESAEHLLRFIGDIGRTNLFINFDPANMILYGTGDPIAALKQVGHLVRSIHCKDATWAAEAVRGKEWGREVPLGEGGREAHAMFAGGEHRALVDGIEIVGVHEVELVFCRHALQQGVGGLAHFNTVPAHVGHLQLARQLGKAAHRARQQIQTGGVALLRAGQAELCTHTYPEDGGTLAEGLAQGVIQSALLQHLHRAAGVPHAGKDHALCAPHVLWIRADTRLRAHGRERALHGCGIAGVVVDDGDHGPVIRLGLRIDKPGTPREVAQRARG